MRHVLHLMQPARPGGRGGDEGRPTRQDETGRGSRRETRHSMRRNETRHQPASASLPCRASGALTDFSHTASGSSSSPKTSRSSTSCVTGRALCRSAVAHCCPFGRREEPDPGARPNPARSADEKGRAGTMTHDYKRNGATTLFAAMNVLDGTVIGRNMPRHRHQEFIRFLNAVEREVPRR
jgi:hypothetical protein